MPSYVAGIVSKCSTCTNMFHLHDACEVWPQIPGEETEAQKQHLISFLIFTVSSWAWVLTPCGHLSTLATSHPSLLIKIFIIGNNLSIIWYNFQTYFCKIPREVILFYFIFFKLRLLWHGSLSPCTFIGIIIGSAQI